MMLDATQKYDQPLTDERLFAWHAALFPTGRSGMRRIKVGAWRDDSSGPMQVVSGPLGRERVHYQAPPASQLNQQMKAFVDWFNAETGIDQVLKAAVAHLWFVTIHPFDDGNGRIARALADMALARSEQSAQRFYSMSDQIRQERSAYYDMLETTQKADLDITPWLQWFLKILDQAFDGVEKILANVFKKARFWEKHAETPFNERQRDMLNRLLEGFEGKLTSSKWASSRLARKIRRFVISTTSSRAEFSAKMRPAAEARAIRSWRSRHHHSALRWRMDAPGVMACRKQLIAQKCDTRRATRSAAEGVAGILKGAEVNHARLRHKGRPCEKCRTTPKEGIHEVFKKMCLAAAKPRIQQLRRTKDILPADHGLDRRGICGDTAAVQALLAKGAEVNAKRSDGATALILASQPATSMWCRRCSPRGPTSMPR